VVVHPKVKWAAVVGVVLTSAIGVLAVAGHPLPPWLAAGVVALLGTVTGYAVPSPDPTPPPTVTLPSGGSITEVPPG
jgi:hypothetical protein